VSAIGEILREIMPAWLIRPDRGAAGRRHGYASDRKAKRKVVGPELADDPIAVARQADAIWQECIDHDQHGEAFPEQIGDEPPAEESAGTRSRRLKRAHPPRKH
jgi:hypothetical protein